MKSLILRIIGIIGTVLLNPVVSYNEGLSTRLIYYDMISYCKTNTIQLQNPKDAYNKLMDTIKGEKFVKPTLYIKKEKK